MNSPGGNTAGACLRGAVKSEHPLQVVGVINAYCARLADRVGFKTLYLSGAGVANASCGIPDLGTTTLDDVLTDVRRITSATKLPVLVDADTGWEDSVGIHETTRCMIDAGAAGFHLEDQVPAKRCGHRPGKVLVSIDDMVDRLAGAVASRKDNPFVIMARTDAVGVEGLDEAIGRADRYVHAGADMIFAEALTDLKDMECFAKAINAPVLANLTEFGRTPMFSLDEMRATGIRLVLYPLSAFRAMSAAAQNTYHTIRKSGTQSSLLNTMQTREELYDVLDYYEHELQINHALTEKKQ